jgi:hypothetical protein
MFARNFFLQSCAATAAAFASPSAFPASRSASCDSHAISGAPKSKVCRLFFVQADKDS